MGQDLTRVLESGRPAERAEWEEALPIFDAMCTTARFADMGARAFAIGHELRQPLFTISMATENLRQMLELTDSPKQQMLMAVERIAEQVERAQAILTGVLQSHSDHSPAPVASDPSEAMDNAVRFLADLCDPADITIERGPAIADCLVPVGRVRMEQIYVNVLRNAVDSILLRRRQGWLGQGRISIGLAVDADSFRCTVSDNGAGMAPDAPTAAFEPFFTTKPVTEGTGLGLFICEKILALAGGAISLRPGDAEGADVHIRLPLSRHLRTVGAISDR